MTATSSPRAGRGRACLRGFISRDDLAASWDAGLTTVGSIALAVAVLAVVRALYPLGVLLFNLAHGGHL